MRSLINIKSTRNITQISTDEILHIAEAHSISQKYIAECRTQLQDITTIEHIQNLKQLPSDFLFVRRKLSTIILSQLHTISSFEQIMKLDFILSSITLRAKNHIYRCSRRFIMNEMEKRNSFKSLEYVFCSSFRRYGQQLEVAVFTAFSNTAHTDQEYCRVYHLAVNDSAFCKGKGLIFFRKFILGKLRKASRFGEVEHIFNLLPKINDQAENRYSVIKKWLQLSETLTQANHIHRLLDEECKVGVLKKEILLLEKNLVLKKLVTLLR